MINIRKKIAAIPVARTWYDCLIKYTIRSGILDFHRFFTGRRHIILTFHRIRATGLPADPYDSCPSMAVETFRQILTFVKSQFTIVSLHELCDTLSRKDAAAVITFDDGWRDNFDVAFPILQELKIPATIFITTGKIGSSTPFWQQALGRIFHAAATSPLKDSTDKLCDILGLQHHATLTSPLYRQTVIQWKRLPSADRENRLARAGDIFHTGATGSRCFMNVEEIIDMAVAGITFGSHTVNHIILPHHPREEIEQELAESKSTLESLLGTRIDMLAYPNGDTSPEITETTRRNGYRIGCTVYRNRVSPQDNLLMMPRIDASWDNSEYPEVFSNVKFNWRIR